MYETLDCFKLIPFCPYETYFEFVAGLVNSKLGMDYGKYSGKILGLLIERLENELKLSLKESGRSENKYIWIRCLNIINDFLETKDVLNDNYVGKGLPRKRSKARWREFSVS